MASEAVSEYNVLIERQPKLLSDSRAYLVEKLNAVRFVFGGRMLSPYLRPHFVTMDEWRRITTACETIWSAIEKVGRAAREDEQIRSQIGLTDAERKLTEIDPGYQEISVTSRLDSFLTEKSYQFVELNAECPAGIAYQDVAAEIFLEMPLMREFSKRWNVRPMYCRGDTLAALLTVYARIRGHAAKPKIGIVDYKGLPTQREFELFKEYFEKRGYKTTIADPRELELRDGKLYDNAFEIDLVYRRVLTTELLEKIDECGALVEAYRTGAAVFVNSFRTKFVHKKMLFGVLTDERHEYLFSEAECKTIRECIPWTRRLEPVGAIYQGQRVDLLELIRRRRDQFVLKPNDNYGGHGIHIGWECDENEWDRAIGEALANDYLVQERVNTSKEVFPYLDQDTGAIRMTEQLLDLDPLLFFGKVRGAFTRLSTSSLANVTSGAGMVPTMIVE
jgi:hypothetical protein